MKFCPQCGDKLQPEQKFCTGCGTPVATSTDQLIAHDTEQKNVPAQKNRADDAQAPNDRLTAMLNNHRILDI